MGLDKFYKNSVILTLSNFITGFIGFAFSIVLSKKLGAEGLGLYGLIMPVYSLLICLTSDGLITAISKMCAVYTNKKDFRNLHRTVKVTMCFIGMWSIIVAFLVFINSSNISNYIIKDSRASDAIKIICPALMFIPMSAIIKGFFYGFGKYTIPAGIDILEKCIRISILLGTLSVLKLKQVQSSVTVAYFALCIGELISLILLYSTFRSFYTKLSPSKAKVINPLQLLSEVLVISCPLCINGFLSSILNTASTLVLPLRLMSTGFSHDESLALIGKFLGMSLTTVYLPYIIVGSIMTVLIPDMSLSLSKKDLWSTERRILQVLKISFLVGMCTLAVSTALSDKLGLVFYNRGDLGPMIKFAGLCCCFSYVSSTSFAILNGLGKQNINLKNSLIVSVEGLLLVIILTGLPNLNIYGYGIALLITSLTGFVLNIYEIRKTCEISFSFTGLLIFCWFGLISFFICKLTSRLIPDTFIVFNVLMSIVLAFLTPLILSRLYSYAKQ